MIEPSILYAITTIMLALVDALRIKSLWGQVDNINHRYSWFFALLTAAILTIYYSIPWVSFIYFALLFAAFISIRVVVFDIVLNLLRILMKTNPTGKIDYVSEKSDSETEQRSNRLSFWQRRALGAAAYGVCLFIHYKLFVE